MHPQSYDLFTIDPTYFSRPNPQGDFSGIGRRRLRLFPSMSEQTALNLPGFLGVKGVIGSPHTPKTLTPQPNREWLS